MELGEFFNGDLFDHFWICYYDSGPPAEAHLVNAAVPLEVFPQHTVHASVFDNIGEISKIRPLTWTGNWKVFEKREANHAAPVDEEYDEA